MIGEAPGQEQSSSALSVQVQRVGNEPKRTLDTLTPKERKALAVLTDPAMYDKTDAERMRAAGVGKTRWYEIVNDPEFARLERDLVRVTVRSSVGAIVHKAISVALNKDRDGQVDRWKLLEMSGHYTPRQQIDHTTAGQPIVGVVGIDPAGL